MKRLFKQTKYRSDASSSQKSRIYRHGKFKSVQIISKMFDAQNLSAICIVHLFDENFSIIIIKLASI